MARCALFDQPYAPSTLGSFLRAFTFGHVRQMDAVASRLLAGLAGRTPLLAGIGQGLVCVDVDDTVIEVHGHAKQGAGFGYNRVRGLNALLATASTATAAPVIVAQRLRAGSAKSARGARRLVADALATVGSLRPARAASQILLRADSAFYGHATCGAAVRAGAQVSVTVRMDPKVKAAIASIGDGAWTAIEYTDAVYDEQSGRWISRAEVAEVSFTAFTGRKKAEQVRGRPVVRRIPDLNPPDDPAQATLFQIWRYHAFFTTSELDTVTAGKTHRGHAIIEQVNADLKNSALAHLPSGKFTANSAWLVCAVMAFNLTRAAVAQPGGRLATATTATIRRAIIAVPARIASSGPADLAPAPGLAVAAPLGRTIHPHLRPTPASRQLATAARPDRRPRRTWQHRLGDQAHPAGLHRQQDHSQPRSTWHRWIED